MDILNQSDSSDRSFDDLMMQADQARAYIDITSTMGPSEQLIAFINYDGELCSELGIGIGMESFSLNTKHEILLSSLKPDVLENLACESLSDSVHKFGKWLGAAGWVGLAYSLAKIILSKSPLTAARLGGVSIAAIFAGKYVVRIINEKGVKPHTYVVKLKEIFDITLNHEEFFYKLIPSSFDIKAWDEFNKYLNGKDSEYIEARGKAFATEYDLKLTRHPDLIFNRSGWTEANFKQETEWLVKAIEQVNTTEEKYSTKIANIAKWIDSYKINPDKETKKVLKIISWWVRESKANFIETRAALDEIIKALNDVGKHFEETDK